MRITAGLSTFRPSCVHRFLISGPDLGIDASFAVSLAARRGGFAQSLRRRMVPPATSVAATTFRVRFYSSMPRKRMVSPAGRHYRAAALILDFRPRLGNRCKLCRVPGRSSRGICAVAALLCRLPGRSPRGPLQRWDLSRSRAARRATIPFCGVRPRESKLSTAWPPKRNQHRLCDADSLIISALR